MASSSRHPGFCPGFRGSAQLCQLPLQDAPLPFLLTLVFVGSTVTEPHSKVQVFSSLDLTFSMLPQFQE